MMKEKSNGVTGVETSTEGIQVKRQRSMKFNLYSNRPRTSSKEPAATTPPSPISSKPPQIPPLPLSSSRGASLPSSIFPTPRPSTSHHSSSNDPYRSFTAQHNPYQRPSEASRLRALNNGNRSRSIEGRRTPDIPGTTDNFSRPRQPSIKRKNGSPKTLIHGGTAFPLRSHDEDQISTDFEGYNTRDRGISISSSQSATGPSPITLRPSTSIPDYQAADSIYSRQRNLTNPNHKSGRVLSRPDSNYSSYRREQFQKPAGFDGEEVRASFRSALTTNSSFLGTSGTERSSVMTKSSSATSIFGRDEGMSVDDAIGMYEDGFGDSEVEDDHEPSPTTSNSEAIEKANQDRRFKLSEAINDTLALPPLAFTIRDSTAIFQAGSTDASPNEIPDNFDGTVDFEKEGYFGQTPTSRLVTSAVKSEFDSTRDRYGFRKKSQNVSLAQYEAWNGPYTEHLARRKKKWVALLKENGLISDHPTRFPRSAKVKRFVRKGIPPDWRGNAWFYYAGGPAMMSKNYGVFDDLIRRATNGEVSETDDEIIERDLNRTFPDNIKFKPDPPPETEPRDSIRSDVEPETPIVQSLRRVLRAFSIYNPKIGYCQSLNFLAGLLLLFMDEERSFWMLNIITGVYLPGTHELNLEGANVDLGVLMTSIKESMPSIWAKIGGELDGSAGDGKVSMRLPPITLCTTAWFMSCFIGTLPIETTLRVWDSFFYEGSKTLFRIALAIFKVGEQEIKAVSDPMEIFQVVQTIPRRLVDANALMEACFKKRNGFGHLTQETIEKRRAERRAGYANERARANGEIPLSRKGTLFSRKKNKPSEI